MKVFVLIHAGVEELPPVSECIEVKNGALRRLAEEKTCRRPPEEATIFKSRGFAIENPARSSLFRADTAEECRSMDRS